jgi:hypothetical protein
MTPEQREELKAKMQGYLANPAEPRSCNPAAILSLIAQVEALEAKFVIGERPADERQWAKVDPAVAFHLIERHADNWNDAGDMMVAWANARQDAQVEALNRKNLELQRVYDERGQQIGRLEAALQRVKVEALTVPQCDEPVETIKRIQRMNMQGMADCMDMVHGELIEAGIIDRSTAPMMVANAVCSYVAELHARLRRALAAPTIPAIPGTKEAES